MSLTDQLAKLGLTLTPVFDGQMYREGSQWIRATDLESGGKPLQVAYFGDFARGLSESWISRKGTTHEEKEKIKQATEEAAASARAEKERAWEEAKGEVAVEWDLAFDSGESPYFTRKGFTGLHGCRLEPHERGPRTLVPARDADGTLWGYQRIYSEKLSLAGTDKIFREGARKEGCLHLLPGTDESGPIYLCEGIATALSVHAALAGRSSVGSCFDAGNLIPVARSLRRRYPDRHFVFAADNDRFPAKDGKVYFTGLKKAQAAAEEVGNAHVVLPYFQAKDDATRPTDFNDAHLLYGLDEVKRQLLAVTPGSEGIQPVSSLDANGKPKKPSEKQICHAFLEHFGDKIIKQGRDIFIYANGYWQWQDETGRDKIKQVIGRLYGNTGAGIKDIKNAFEYICVYMPHLPEGKDLFIPLPYCCNFTNGTLFVTPDPGKEPKLHFREHRADDWISNQLPYEFPGLDKLDAHNAAFDTMLDRIFKGDPDKEGKIRVLAQMYGAVLIPCFAKIFFLVGPKGSGKSTVMKLLHRLASKQNVSHVDPSHFFGFNMDGMVGKLLNMVTDIDLHKPINDSVIKQITDRIPFRIARKFQSDLLALLPPIHIWGGNNLPQSMEGATGAYERRAVIVAFAEAKEAFRAEVDGFDHDFDEWIWGQGWEGILAFAMRGLVDLLKSKGHYAVPESSKRKLAEWDSRSDILGQFLEALEHKELDQGNQYCVAEGAQISRKDLWECFASWQEGPGRSRAPWDEKKLCSAMRNKGFQDKKVHGVRIWVGVGIKMAPDSLV